MANGPHPFQACSEVVREDLGGVSWLRINRPDRRNAISSAVSRSIAWELGRIAGQEEIIGAVITGSGDYFSAGVDLREYLEAYERGTLREIVRIHKALFVEAVNFPKPLVLAINGPAYGLGVELAHFSDLVIMSRGASMSIGGTRFGMVPPIMNQAIPASPYPRRLLYITATSDTLTDQEAVALGLADIVVEKERLYEESARAVKSLATTGVLARLKGILRDQRLGIVERGFDEYMKSLEDPETIERIRRFVEGRRG